MNEIPPSSSQRSKGFPFSHRRKFPLLSPLLSFPSPDYKKRVPIVSLLHFSNISILQFYTFELGNSFLAMISMDLKDDGGVDANKCSLSEQQNGVERSGDDLGGNCGDVVMDVGCNRGSDCVGADEKEEKMCRVCHLASDCFSQSGDLIQLGCRCKDDLGTAHRSCAELWFATKGDRFCEICGEVAKNVSEFGENRFMVQWNDAPIQSQLLLQQRYQTVCIFFAAMVFMVLAMHWIFHEKRHQNPS